MAEKRNLFATASSALGNQSKPKLAPTAAVQPQAESAPPAYVPYVEAESLDVPLARFTVHTRQGAFWSYPYAHVGLIECPAQDLLVIHCTCGAVETIEIRGRGLRKIAECLTAGHLQALFETEHAKFARDVTVVTEVVIRTHDV